MVNLSIENGKPSATPNDALNLDPLPYLFGRDALDASLFCWLD